MISLRNFGYRTPAKGVLGTCRSVFPREFSRNWQKMCTPHFLELWLFNAPLSLGCLTPPKTCWSPRNANYSWLLHVLLIFNCVLHNSSKDSWSLPATKSFFPAFCLVSRVQDTWKCTGTLWSQVDCFFQMLSVLQAHGIPSPLSLYLPQEKLWSALHTNCYYSTTTQNLFQIVYTTHIIILLFNNLADTLWKKTFTSCLSSWSLVLLF